MSEQTDGFAVLCCPIGSTQKAAASSTAAVLALHLMRASISFVVNVGATLIS
jgi:hypothetical protein